jgi:hypothetical protein
MNQYVPKHRALGDPVWGRGLDAAEYARAVEMLEELGLAEGWVQE